MQYKPFQVSVPTNPEGDLTPYQKHIADLELAASQGYQPFSSMSPNDTTTANFSNTLSLEPGNSLSTPVEYQNLSSPSMSVGSVAPDAGMSASAGTMAGAGMQAAAQAATAIAQAAALKAQQDQMVAGNAANRASSEKMARAALAQSSSQFDSTNQMNAYQMMLAALGQAANQTMAQRALNRSNTNNRSDGLTTAFLGA